MTDAGSYIHVGPEIGVASTKAFTGQVVILTLLALRLAMEKKTMNPEKAAALAGELSQVPDRIRELLKQAPKVKEIVGELFKTADNALFLGRGYNFPVALEGALKLKEISYIHAEGYPAAEMKHGPIALIDEHMPVVVVATNRDLHGKVVSNIQEIKARKGKVLALVSQGDEEIRSMADYVIEIPETLDPLTPLLSVIPLQLLAYHAAVLRGKNVDQPRNLAKSVTVE
jgi:glucosamine--fructose-6-phosphate aminotransferase (isomerizing)